MKNSPLTWSLQRWIIRSRMHARSCTSSLYWKFFSAVRIHLTNSHTSSSSIPVNIRSAFQTLHNEKWKEKKTNEYRTGLVFWSSENGWESSGKNSVKLYYRFLYNPDQMMYDGVEIKGMAQCERRSSWWIATRLPCVISISNSCSAVLKKNCASLCCALIRRMKKT